MIYQKLRKAGNSYVVTIPKKEVERLGLKVGDTLALSIQRAELSEELRKLFEEDWKDNEAGYRYLAKR